MTWTKGASGNPKGRPKRQDALSAWLRKIGRIKTEDGITFDKAVILSVYKAAIDGDMGAARLILEFRLGKPALIQVDAKDDVTVKLYVSVSPDDWPDQ